MSKDFEFLLWKENIQIEVKDSNLVISGTNQSEDDSMLTYVQRNIAKRDFQRVIHLDSEYLNGEFYADMEDGILTISINPKTPPSTVIKINW